MIDKRTWAEFRNSGFLWWINMILHTFGWAIVAVTVNEDIVNVYPARVKFRGFSEECNAEGYEKVSKYMKRNANDLLAEAKDK